MRVAVILAVAGLIALILAVLTGSTWAGFAVIILAVAGIALLLRDWRDERISDEPIGSSRLSCREINDQAIESSLTADDFSPDLSTDPDGPSSDARADQL
jgi:hypothetical protein